MKPALAIKLSLIHVLSTCLTLTLVACKEQVVEVPEAQAPDVEAAAVTLEPSGTINGSLTGADTGEPLKETRIILCLFPDLETDDYVCTLQAMPTALTDANGAFVLDKVPLGSYALTYGFADELVSNPDEWGGVTVDTRVKHWDGWKMTELREGVFWQDGQSFLDGEIDFTIASDHQPHLGSGSVKSNYFGIWITAEDLELTPIVQVQAGETTDLNWQVSGR